MVDTSTPGSLRSHCAFPRKGFDKPTDKLTTILFQLLRSSVKRHNLLSASLTWKRFEHYVSHLRSKPLIGGDIRPAPVSVTLADVLSDEARDRKGPASTPVFLAQTCEALNTCGECSSGDISVSREEGDSSFSESSCTIICHSIRNTSHK